MVTELESNDVKNRWKSVVVCILCMVLIGTGAFLFYFLIYKVEPVFQTMTYEYGNEVSRDIEDYLTGTDWSVHLGELDLSQVNEKETGTYQAVVRHGKKAFVYEITIQDTVSPEILWRESQVYLATGRNCAVEDVIAGVEDVDRRTQAFFLEEGEPLSEIRFDQAGEYTLEILARDRAGNETRGEVSAIVDTPPSIDGVRSFYVIPGSAPEFLELVTARDDLDGDLTESIQLDDSGVRLDQEGVYKLRYLSRDGYGLETVEETQVVVAAPEDIQELIGQRQIDYRVDCILGAPNIYDGGVSEHEDMGETLEYMRPAIVQLYHSTGQGGYSAGSGYIMEITEDTVYICTNNHVLEKFADWDVFFFDGTKIPGKRLGTSEVYDVGVVEVARSDVPEELLERLMTVHIDRTYWESLNQQDIVLALERVDKSGGLVHTSTGNLIKIKQDFDWFDQRPHTEVTLELVHGDSGSAVLDGYGNLICMAFAYSTEPTRYWCVPLDGILSCYEEITGRVPYVY